MRIITDTSTLYSPSEGEELGITVLPLSVTANNKTYREFLDINSEEFTTLIKNGAIPTSSQPPIGEVIEVFEKEKDELLVISMADGLSGTYQSVVGAKECIENNEHIHIINSKTLCGTHRYLVQKAKKMKDEGCSLDEIIEKMHKSIASAKSFLIPQDFGYLKRGGRLTPFAATIGGMLKIVPIMSQTEDGKKLETFTIKRTLKGAVNEIIKFFNTNNINENYRIYVSHGSVLKQALEVVKQIEKSFENITIELLELSPAFITQGGPGCIAIQMIEL